MQPGRGGVPAEALDSPGSGVWGNGEYFIEKWCSAYSDILLFLRTGK